MLMALWLAFALSGRMYMVAVRPQGARAVGCAFMPLLDNYYAQTLPFECRWSFKVIKRCFTVGFVVTTTHTAPHIITALSINHIYICTFKLIPLFSTILL